MDIETMKAYEWALNQNFGSVAAQYAKKLALYIQSAKSATSDEVAEAIEQLKYAREQDREFDDGTFVDSLDLAITALQAYQPWIPVSEGKRKTQWYQKVCELMEAIESEYHGKKQQEN